MTDHAKVVRLAGDYTAEDLRVIAGALVEADAGAVCEVALVVIVHEPDGGHGLRVAVSTEEGPASVALTLRHAADHIYGGCESCRLRNQAADAPARPPKHSAGPRWRD